MYRDNFMVSMFIQAIQRSVNSREEVLLKRARTKNATFVLNVLILLCIEIGSYMAMKVKQRLKWEGCGTEKCSSIQLEQSSIYCKRGYK